jgi:hypothetical protein
VLTVNGLAATTVCGNFTIAGSGLSPSTSYSLDFYSPAITPPGPTTPPPTYLTSFPANTDSSGSFSDPYTVTAPNGTQYQAVVAGLVLYDDYKTNPVTFTVNCP